MAKVTLEGLMDFMLEHMATKNDLAHATDLLGRKIEQAEINAVADNYKQRLELEAFVKRETDELAQDIKKQADHTGERIMALEQSRARAFG